MRETVRSIRSLAGAVLAALFLAACQTVDIPYARQGELPTPVVVEDASPERTALNAQVFDAVANWVDRLYYDPRMGGRDWATLTARHREQAIAQATEADFYRQVEAMLDELDDRHTNVTSPSSRAVEARQEAEEQTVGFGLTAIREGEDYVVARVRSNSAASEAGVQIGWRLEAVNGLEPSRTLVPSESRADVFDFTDEAGAPHRITLTGRPIEARPRREAIRREDGIEIVRFDGFDGASRDWMAEQRARWVADPPSAIIMDLRDNPGGRLDVLSDIFAGFFRERVPFAVVLRRLIDLRYFTVLQDDPWIGPLAVLVGPGSGSASELFAAAVQDRNRGPVVGARTAGAVIGSRQLNLPDGGELSVSTQAILTNDRTLLEKVGVTPDIVTDPSLADLRAGRDPTLLAAIAALNRDQAGSIKSQALP